MTSTPSLLPSVLSLLMVLALVPVALWALKRLQGARAGAPGALRLVASLPLGPRERVAVVNVAGRALVLGVTAHGITHLASLDEPLPEPDPTAAASPFARALAQRLSRQPHDTAPRG